MNLATDPSISPVASHQRLGLERALNRESRRPADAGEFQRLMALGRRPAGDDPRGARAAAEMMVAQLFYQPLLAEARRSPFQSDIGHGGRGEDVFGEQLDTLLADRIARSQQGGLVAALESRLARRYAVVAEPAERDAELGLDAKAQNPRVAGPDIETSIRETASWR